MGISTMTDIKKSLETSKKLAKLNRYLKLAVPSFNPLGVLFLNHAYLDDNLVSTINDFYTKGLLINPLSACADDNCNFTLIPAKTIEDVAFKSNASSGIFDYLFQPIEARNAITTKRAYKSLKLLKPYFFVQMVNEIASGRNFNDLFLAKRFKSKYPLLYMYQGNIQFRLVTMKDIPIIRQEAGCCIEKDVDLKSLNSQVMRVLLSSLSNYFLAKHLNISEKTIKELRNLNISKLRWNQLLNNLKVSSIRKIQELPKRVTNKEKSKLGTINIKTIPLNTDFSKVKKYNKIGLRRLRKHIEENPNDYIGG